MKRYQLLWGVLWIASGCAAREGREGGEELVHGAARVELSYTHQMGAAEEEVRFDAEAHFVRVRGLDPEAVPTLLGLADFGGIPAESCRGADATAELDEALAADTTGRGTAAEVALLDAGPIEVRGPVDRASLTPHSYPELLSFVSGIVYGADESRAPSLLTGQPLQVVGEGGAEVGPFNAVAMVPGGFPWLEGTELHRGADLELRWADAGADPAEPLLLEVSWAGRAGARAVRCRVRDDGAFTIPGTFFEALPAVLPGGLQLTATRAQRAPLRSLELGRGELTVALRDLARLQVSP